jgi:hypothetical protein
MSVVTRSMNQCAVTDRAEAPTASVSETSNHLFLNSFIVVSVSKSGSARLTSSRMTSSRGKFDGDVSESPCESRYGSVSEVALGLPPFQ